MIALMLITTLAFQDSSALGLPLREFPAAESGPVLAILLTGDGGFAEFDRQLADGLAARGIAVVGLNSRAYLSTPRTPDETARDVARVASAYLAKWQRQTLVLVGYSRGATLAPFIANRLPAELRERLRLLVMVGLLPNANFHYHTIDLIKDVHRDDDRPTLPEVERLRGLRMLCIYGSDEKDSGCRDADSTLVERHERKGGHRVKSDFEEITDLIMEEIRGVPGVPGVPRVPGVR